MDSRIEEPLNVLVLMDFSDAIMERLKQVSPRLKFTRKIVKSASEISPEVWANVDILYTITTVPEPDTAPRLRWIQAHTAGVNELMKQPLLTAEEIIVTTTSGIHATTMAEFTFTMILAFARKIPMMLRYQANADWPADRVNLFSPHQLRGSTLGIVGYGSLGREIARIAQAFGMEVLATRRNLMNTAPRKKFVPEGGGDPENSYVQRLYPPEATRSMVAMSDFVVIAVPLTPDTYHLINREVLTAMKKTAVLINIARGDVVDEEALIEVLDSCLIGGAALDVFSQEPLPTSSPLWKMDNVIISPHISGNTNHYHESAAEVFAQNLERYLNRRDLLNVVDRKLGY